MKSVHTGRTLTPQEVKNVKAGIPIFCIMSTEERKAAWDANPPKAVDWRGIEENERKARDKATALAIAQIEEVKTLNPVRAKRQAAPPIDITGKRWNARRCVWEPNPFYIAPKKGAKRAAAKIVATAKPIGAKATGGILKQFDLKEGSQREIVLKALIDQMSAPRSAADLAIVAFGSKDKEAQVAGAIGYLVTRARQKGANYSIEKTASGFQLFEM